MLQKKEKAVDGRLGMYPRVILQFFSDAKFNFRLIETISRLLRLTMSKI